MKMASSCTFKSALLSLFLHFMSFTFVVSIHAQRRNEAYLNYIDKYKHMAMEQMARYQIPASITLAQGLLESRAGQSELARKANNHFGIKCSGDWTGPYFVQDDDYRNEHFRVYKSVRESYEDHSRFLQKRRYASLFQLGQKDYKGWAKGLKAAGYATNPQYASLLINIIELYDLQRFDSKSFRSEDVFKERMDIEASSLSHRVYYNNKNYYIIARAGDTFESISKEMGVSSRKLIRYNELYKTYQIKTGDIIYMEKKRSKASRQFRKKKHVVSAGESYYSISQKYGIRLKSIYSLNHFNQDHTIAVGEELRIR